MNVALGIVSFLAGLKLGDWKKFNKYYPTILFLIIGDLLYNLFTYNSPMWSYNKSWFLRNHLLNNLWIMITVYPATVMIFLTYFPKKFTQQIKYIFFWVSLYIVLELLALNYFNLIDHFNGWNIWWSLLLDTILFTMLYVHYKKPLLAWGISFLLIIFFLKTFHVNIVQIN